MAQGGVDRSSRRRSSGGASPTGSPPNGGACGECCAAPRMSPVQEVFNGLTMVPTACMSLHTILFPSGGSTPQDLVLAAAILIHFPFSFLYHLHCAVHHGTVDPIENNLLLKLDLAFIHISGTFMALATSRSFLWFLGNGVFNLVSAYRILKWRNTMTERRVCRLVCALGYMLPVLVVDSVLFFRTLLAFLAMAGCFVFNQQLRGWGHSLSHMLLVPFAACLFAAS